MHLQPLLFHLSNCSIQHKQSNLTKEDILLLVVGMRRVKSRQFELQNCKVGL